MRDLADGDRSAFPVVFDSLWPLLLGFSRRLLRDPDEAEDAAQNALMKVFEHAARFDRDGDAVAWAVAIAANECRVTRRKRARAEPIDEKAHHVPSPENELIERDLLAAAALTVGDLRPADIATLHAAWSGTRPTAMSAGFRKRLQRAKERLRSAWRSRHGAI
jgi:RNA polymerase sigma-70 factor (ECF subfamily)